MIYGSVCSGIEAASVAWHPLGWRPAFFAEISAFPSAVLAVRWPDVQNLGDFTAIGAAHGPVDVLVGGTPCQSFSIAGGRAGLDDPRGHLAVEFVRTARRLGARWVVWENVPGVLSSGGGQDYGDLLGVFVDAGYGIAWRVLDAQWFGVAQRRRRLFVVGYLGDWRRAVAVLFERPSMHGNPAARRGEGADVAAGAQGRADGVVGTLLRSAAKSTSSSAPLIADVASTLISTAGRHARIDTPLVTSTLLAHHGRSASLETPLTVDVGDVSVTLTTRSGRQDPATDPYAVAFHATQDPISGGVSPCLASQSQIGVLAFDEAQITSATNRANPRPGGPSPTLASSSGGRVTVANVGRPRRLTPLEWERLQGFPDGYTAILTGKRRPKLADDAPRYAALGNSFAVPVVRWIGKRIAFVDAIPVQVRRAA